MNMNKIIKTASAFSFIAVLLWSCDPENPGNPNDQEVITSVKVTATSTSDTIVFSYSDPDGNGGNVPVIDTAVFASSQVYHVSLELLDETKTPVDTITHEIEDEAVDHQFFFTLTNANISTAYDDLDVNGHPVGLESTWTTAGVSSGTLMVTLRHQPNKSGAGVPAGNITNAGGETDIEIVFPVRIE
jgi:hypothetical protein